MSTRDSFNNIGRATIDQVTERLGRPLTRNEEMTVRFNQESMSGAHFMGGLFMFFSAIFDVFRMPSMNPGHRNAMLTDLDGRAEANRAVAAIVNGADPDSEEADPQGQTLAAIQAGADSAPGNNNGPQDLTVSTQMTN